MKYHINVRATILCNATRLGSEISIVTPADPFSSSFSGTSYIWYLSLLPGLQFISVRYASAPRTVWCACRTVSIGQESGRPSKVFEDLSGNNSNYPLIPWKKQSETVSSHCIAIVSMGNCFPKNPKQSYVGFSKPNILIRTVNPKLWSYWTIVPNRSYELWLEVLLPFQRTTFIEHQRSTLYHLSGWFGQIIWNAPFILAAITWRFFSSLHLHILYRFCWFLPLFLLAFPTFMSTMLSSLRSICQVLLLVDFTPCLNALKLDHLAFV